MPRLFRLVLILLLLQIFISKALAEPTVSEIPAGKKADSKSDGIKVKFHGQMGVEYSDNTFQLSEGKKKNLESPDPEDEENGRFENMESASDVILRPLLGLDLTMDSPLGGELDLASSVAYNIYAENTEADFTEVKLAAEHTVGENGRATLEFDWLTGCFNKNYLSGADDSNTNGNISKDERQYSAAIYDEYEGMVAYRHTLLKHKHEPISRLDIEPFINWTYRIHNSTFKNRNKRVIGAGATARFELFARLTLKTTYTYEDVQTPGGSELVLFDETWGGADVNGDGEVQDHAALVTSIDRSCSRHSVEIAPELELTDNCALFGGVKYRWSYYHSDNALDIDHYDQWSLYKEFEAGLDYDISKKWSAQLAFTKQEDDTSEEDYAENRFMASVKFRLGKWSPELR